MLGEQMTSITNYLKSKLVAWVPFQEIEGLSFKLAYLSKEELIKLRNAATRKTYNPRLRDSQEDFDLKLFTDLFIAQAVLGWEGLTLESLTNLVPIEIPEGVDSSQPIEYSKEEALIVFNNSPALELWLNAIVSDLETFRSSSKGTIPGATS